MGAAGSIDLGNANSSGGYQLSETEIEQIYDQTLQVIKTACGVIQDGESKLKVSATVWKGERRGGGGGRNVLLY